MPIPLAKLQQSERSIRERVLDFLRKDLTQAYAAVEIDGGIEGCGCRSDNSNGRPGR